MTRDHIIPTDDKTEELATKLFDSALDMAEEINKADFELGAEIRDLKITVEVKIEQIEENE